MNQVGFGTTIKEEAGFLRYEGYQTLMLKCPLQRGMEV